MAQHNGDIPTGVSKLNVPKAAQALGISPEAVRNRLSRGTLNSVKEDGTVYVLLDTDRLRHTEDTSRHTTDTPSDISGESTVLISAKDETIRVLRDQLEAEREANRENRRIIAGLVQRVPELEPAPEPLEAPETATNLHPTVDPQGDDAGRETAKHRSWWHRLFR